MFSFERRHERLAPIRVFVWRMIKSIGVALLLLLSVLTFGISGYHWIAGLGWVDSILEASMILSGMGPVNPLPSAEAKLFASGYALFSGVLFIGVVGVVITPVVHRIMHKFHLAKDANDR